jgi:hypothetical protein
MNVVVTAHLRKVLRANIHYMVVKNVENINTGQTATSVPSFCHVNQLEEGLSVEDGFCLEHPESFARDWIIRLG